MIITREMMKKKESSGIGIEEEKKACDRHRLLYLQEYRLLALKAIIMQLLVKMHARKILYNTIV